MLTILLLIIAATVLLVFLVRRVGNTGKEKEKQMADSHSFKPFYVADDGTIVRGKNQANVGNSTMTPTQRKINEMFNSDNSPASPVETGYLCRDCGALLPQGARFCPSCGRAANSPIIVMVHDPIKWKAYFREILQRNFPQYVIKEDVPVTALTSDTYDVFRLYQDRPNQVYKAEWGKPYDFVFSLGDKTEAVVMLGDGHAHHKNVKYLISKMFAKKLKVPYIGFYTNFPNKEDYVLKRIKEQLH